MELQDTIVQIRGRLASHREIYERNEEAVRNQIINPLLRSLGWDPEDPDKVLPNVGTQDGIPDYTLRKNRKTELFIEAKKLSVDTLDRKVMEQLARYTVGQGCPLGIITNGNTWLLIRSFEAGKLVQDRVIWRTDIEIEPDSVIAHKLGSIAFGSIGSIETWVNKTRAIDDVWNAMKEDADLLAAAVTSAVKERLGQVYPALEFNNDEITDILSERIERMFATGDTQNSSHVPTIEEEVPTANREYFSASQIKLDGQLINIHHAYDILVETAEWLIKRHKLSKERCPVASGHKRYIVNSVPKHRYGDDFWNARKLSNGLFIELHAPGSAQLDKAKKLLEHCGISSSSIQIVR